MGSHGGGDGRERGIRAFAAVILPVGLLGDTLLAVFVGQWAAWILIVALLAYISRNVSFALS
jgi:hypothetical protein